MARKHIDCREFPSESRCTIAISADSEDELIEAAAHHAVQVHDHQDGPELRAQLEAPLERASRPPNACFPPAADWLAFDMPTGSSAVAQPWLLK